MTMASDDENNFEIKLVFGKDRELQKNQISDI